MRSINGVHLARLLGEWAGSGTAGPAYARLAAAVRLLILDGRVALSTRLPGERELADALRVSRTTVTAAYDALRADGYAASRQGSGTWTTLPDTRSLDENGAPWAAFSPESGDLINLTHASPEAPAQALREAYDVALGQLPRYLPGSGYHLRGLPELRAAIADRFTARGLPTSAEQVLVTAGAQHAFSLILATVTSAGDRVLVEHPTYPNTLDGARRANARLVPVALTDEGWDVDATEAALRQTAPRLAFLMPDFNNPTGLLAGDRERAALADLVVRTRTLTVVDETLAELNLDGVAQPPPFASYAPPELVLTVGSTSKSLWGGLRVGWIRADPAMIRRLAAVRATDDLASAVLEQLAVTHLLRHIDEVLDVRRAVLRDRRDALAAALVRRLPSWQFRIPAGGLVLWCDLGAAISSALVSAGERHGVGLVAGPRFGVDGAFERRLRLPYTLPADALVDAVDRIAAAYHGIADQTPALEGLT